MPTKPRKCKITFMKKFGSLLFRWAVVITFAILLIFFYLRYVPIVRYFQAILIPILIFLFLLTFIKRKSGILLFTFLIPVTNSIPYFFHIKSAPIGLVIFLPLFLSLLLRWAVLGEKPFKIPSVPFYNTFLFISLISFLLSFLRYANFFPLKDDSIHEWVVNSANLRAGGAIFSVIHESFIVISGILFLSILMMEKEEKFLFNAMLCFIAGLSISSLFSIIQIMNNYIGVESFWIRLKRVNGLATDPNSFGISLSLMIPFLLFLILEKRKILVIPIFLLFFVSLFLSGSRSGFGNFVLSTIFFLYLFLKSGKKRIILTFAAILIFIFAIASLSIIKPEKLNLSERLLKSGKQLKEGRLETFLMGRNILWKAGFLMAREYPISGVGLGAYIVELPNFYKEYNLVYIPPLEEYKKGHPQPFTDTSGNLYLQFLAETGIVGLFSFLIFWFYILISATFKNLNPFSSSSLWAFSFISLFGFHILNPDVLFPVFLLLRFLILEGERSKFLKLSQLFIILFFGISFLISSTTSLSIKNRTKKFGWEQDYGLYKLEKYEGGDFRWTKKGAGFEIFVKSSFLSIDLNASHPDIEKNPLKVKIFISESPFEEKKKMDEFFIREKGWRKRGYSVKEFEGKKAFISFEVSRTWNPMKKLGVPDPRKIGIGIGRIDFEIKEVGFYNWENEHGIIFRWTQKSAFLPILVKSEKIVLFLRVSHPDADKNPVKLTITINGELVEKEVFNDHNWYEIELDLSKHIGKKILMGFSVSRTWCPSDYGINDRRELGVAIGRFE